MSDPLSPAVPRSHSLLPAKLPSVWSLSLDVDAAQRVPSTSATAIVYCEANFGAVDGKTANGLVRHSEKYEILAVIDSESAGLDSGAVLGGTPNGIPIYRDLADALSNLQCVPESFIYGIAPASGTLSPRDRALIREAMGLGMNIVCGLHEFLGEDPEFIEASAADGVALLDVRRPPARRDLRAFTGRVAGLPCLRVAVLGTDCAVGKRTSATVLVRALNDAGIKSILIGTGQTGLIQGARHGLVMDALPSQFCAGQLEATILDAYGQEEPAVIVVEGQGALSHPAYSTSASIIRGSCPQAVVLQHAPGRSRRCDFDFMPMPTAASEIRLIETFADTSVIGLTVNPEHMTDDEIRTAFIELGDELGIPVMDPLTCGPDELVRLVTDVFPELAGSRHAVV